LKAMYMYMYVYFMLNVKRFKSLVLFQGYVSPWREKIGVKHLSKYGLHSKYTLW